MKEWVFFYVCVFGGIENFIAILSNFWNFVFYVFYNNWETRIVFYFAFCDNNSKQFMYWFYLFYFVLYNLKCHNNRSWTSKYDQPLIKLIRIIRQQKVGCFFYFFENELCIHIRRKCLPLVQNHTVINELV